MLHVFVDRGDYRGPFAPGYRALDVPAESAGLAAIDHVVGNVQLGKMNDWVHFYHEVMGFRQLIHFDDQDIGTEYSALMSKVMQDGTGRIKFPINEPADGKRKSQIEEYLDYYLTPGVQHIAMATGDILATVRTLRSRGIEFLRVPDAYYDLTRERVGDDRPNPSRPCVSWASWWIATMKATCCRSSHGRSRTGRPRSSRSSSGTAAGVSARATSKRCSRRSSWSRQSAATSDLWECAT